MEYEKNNDNILIGKKLIEAAISLDESLIDLLNVEVKRLKQLTRSNYDSDELQRTNNLVRNIIIAITLTDEKIKAGIDLYLSKNQN